MRPDKAAAALSSASSSSSPASSSSKAAGAAAPVVAAVSPIGSVEYTTGNNGLEKVVLRGPRRSSAEVPSPTRNRTKI